MRAAGLLVSTIILWMVHRAHSIPVFNTANDYDLNGNACPLPPQYNRACPLLCVTSHDLCPPALAPACPSGQIFCLDGTCQTSCEGITNACMCNDLTASYTNYAPCMTGQLVNITHYNSTLGQKQVEGICASGVGLLSTSIGVWGTDYDKAYLWASCPTAPDPTFTFREPMWIAVWSLMSTEAALLVLWHIYKTGREYTFHRSMRSSTADAAATASPASSSSLAFYSDEKINVEGNENIMQQQQQQQQKKQKKDMWADSSETSSLQDSERLTFRGFNTDYFGSFVLGSVAVVTLLFIIFLGTIVSDYYGNVRGTEFAVFLASDLSSKIFCAVWHIASAWFAAVLLYHKRLLNYFRIENYTHNAKYIQVERRQKEQVFLDDGNRLIAKLRQIEQHIVKRLRMDILVETHKVKYTANKLRFFEYQCMRYVFSAEKHKFEPYAFDLGSTNRNLHEYAIGLTTEEVAERQDMLGANIIKVHVPSIPVAIAQEFASLLYLYQVMCMWVWYYFGYYKMGLVQTCIILVAALVRVALRLRAENRVKAMAEYVDKICVLRDGEWQEDISTGDLVPGDIFEIRENTQLPCDAVILSGTVVVNESSLTGEAMPIRKNAIHNDDSAYDMMGTSKNNTLFAGTLVAQVTPTLDGNGRAYALAFRTGISSEKGMLIHKILFPVPVSFIFNEHIKLAICTLLLWGGIAFALSVWWMGRGNITSWFYGVFVISEIFSPLLPASFTINQSVSAARLRTKNILCLDLPRINLSGKVRIFCFDKTGTLTREGLEFYGSVVKPVMSGPFPEREEDPLKMDRTLAMGIATCHAVTKVQGQYIGNPVDIESFNAMKWELQPPADADYLDTFISPVATPNEKTQSVHVLRRFEFVHARASQSVAVYDPVTGHVRVFLKGSFEKVKHLSDPASVPAEYDQTAANYAREGCYVLALASRDLGVLGEDVTMEAIKQMTREELEADCQFTGFVLFRNMLKHDTTEAITELKGGDTRTVMITGDTALTGIFIARQCGMIEPGQRVLLGDVIDNTVVWNDVDSGTQVDVDEVLMSDPHENHQKRIDLAITGRAFEALISENKMRSYLLLTRVFARMTPTDKVQCVRLHMEKGITAMCGDGGNDCGALRAAHVGLALSEAEASIVSPFSTNNRSIMQCVELLRQGRSALATSFANYKFLIFYGECMACWELIMFYFTVIAPQPIWITIDGFIVTFMTFAITQARPAKKLGPSRPTAKPVGPYTLMSIIGVVLINFWFIVCSVIWLFQQEWFVCNEFDSATVNSALWWLIGDNYEAEVISLVVIFQFFHNAAVVNFGSIYRQSWWRNYILVFFWCCFFVSTSYLTLADPNPYSCIFRINCGTASVIEGLGYPTPYWNIADYNSPLGHNVLPKSFRWKLWVFILGNMLATVIWERVVMLTFVRRWVVKRNATNPPKNRLFIKL